MKTLFITYYTFFTPIQTIVQVDVQVSNANFSHVSSAAKVISSAAVDQKQIIAVVEERTTNRALIVPG